MKKYIFLAAHGHIVSGRLMAGIYDQNAQRDKTILSKIVFHQAAPTVTFFFGDFGVTITGQIRKIDLAINAKIIDLRGFSRCGPHAGKILAVQQAVDHRGFSHIGAARKCHLRTTVANECGGFDCGKNEFCLIKVDGHGVPPDRVRRRQ